MQESGLCGDSRHIALVVGVEVRWRLLRFVLGVRATAFDWYTAFLPAYQPEEQNMGKKTRNRDLSKSLK